jgi:hypothetical protein
MPGFGRCRVVARGEVLPNPPIPFSYIPNLAKFAAEKKTLRSKLWGLTGEWGDTRGTSFASSYRRLQGPTFPDCDQSNGGLVMVLYSKV